MSTEPRIRLVSRATGFADSDLVEIVLAGFVRQGAISIEVRRGRRQALVSLSQARMLAALATARALGFAATFEMLTEALWGDDPEGGPNDTRTTMNVQLMRLRRAILPLGMTIGWEIWGVSYSLDVAPAAKWQATV